MGIRETLNRNSGMTAGAVGGVIVLAIIYSVYYVMGGGSGGQVAPTADPKLWFTVDDGQSFFADNASKTPPFDRDGKQAVQCYVFSCDHGKTKFVGYLQRYTPKAKARRELLLSKGTTIGMEELGVNGVEIKPPQTGERGWISYADPRATIIQNVKCKNGKQEDLEPIFAE